MFAANVRKQKQSQIVKNKSKKDFSFISNLISESLNLVSYLPRPHFRQVVKDDNQDTLKWHCK